MRACIVMSFLLLSGCAQILGIEDLTAANEAPDAKPDSRPSAFDAGGTADAAGCGVTPTLGDIGDPGGDASLGSTNDPTQYVQYLANLNADPDQVLIALYSDLGAFAGGLSTGTFPLVGDEVQFRTCGLCVLLFADVSSGVPAGYYMATGGTVRLDSVTGTISGSLENVTFAHVNIADDFTSTLVGDGCDSIITSATFSAPIP